MSIHLISINAAELREITAALPPYTDGQKELLIISDAECIKLLAPIPGATPPDNNQLIKYIKRSGASAPV